MTRIIAGPCQHESLEQSLEIATECERVCQSFGFDYIFKASYDKANRSHDSGIRGVGIDETLKAFREMRKELPNIQILTDVHTTAEINRVKDSVDVLQIPAFLARQTDLIKAACATDCIVNIKKSQFMAPWDISGVLSKTEEAKEVWITERGVCFGYNNLVVDFNGIQYMLDNYDVPLVFDATHSVQKPSALGKSSGGNRDYVAGLTRSASALGVNNFFLEVHKDPPSAPSDGANMVYLKNFKDIVYDIYRYSYSL